MVLKWPRFYLRKRFRKGLSKCYKKLSFKLSTKRTRNPNICVMDLCIGIDKN
jgi:hypothetical protein